MAAMVTERFIDKIAAASAAQKFLCVGLDPDLSKFPAQFASLPPGEAILAFNRAIIDATADIAGSYKPNTAFYEAYGEAGWAALKETVEYIRSTAPEAPVIMDAKRADIGNTNEGYVRAVFEYLGADAITVHPYLGREALAPFLNSSEIGVFVLCRTSNAGAGELQDLSVDGTPLYLHLARLVNERWNGLGNCGLVVGATYPDEIASVRAVAPELPLLIPGIGAQGGDLERTVQAARGKGDRMIISSSRSILYASNGADYADAARRSAQEFDSQIRAAAVR